MATITLQGNEINTSGDLPAAGGAAPGFKLVDKDLNDVSLSDFKGKKKLLNIVPSLDTPVCATSTKRSRSLKSNPITGPAACSTNRKSEVIRYVCRDRYPHRKRQRLA